MSDFESHFQEAYEAGRSEEEIFRSLGSEQAIAREILAQYGLELPSVQEPLQRKRKPNRMPLRIAVL